MTDNSLINWGSLRQDWLKVDLKDKLYGLASGNLRERGNAKGTPTGIDRCGGLVANGLSLFASRDWFDRISWPTGQGRNLRSKSKKV